MKDRGSRRPTGSFADLTGKPVNRLRGHCARCGAGLDNRRKKFCGPCAADRLRETNAINGAKYRERARQ